jgi:hypothetical protein
MLGLSSGRAELIHGLERSLIRYGRIHQQTSVRQDFNFRGQTSSVFMFRAALISESANIQRNHPEFPYARL